MTTVTLTDITSAIADANLDEDDLLALNRFVNDEIKTARHRKDRQVLASLRPGDTVKVTGRLRGNALLGEQAEVIRVNRTRVVCQFDGDVRHVTVPASVLTKVA
jgi:hypothetical protein